MPRTKRASGAKCSGDAPWLLSLILERCQIAKSLVDRSGPATAIKGVLPADGRGLSRHPASFRRFWVLMGVLPRTI